MLAGFSQGAVIAGDVAASIGDGTGQCRRISYWVSGLIADGRRDPAASRNTVAPSVAGVGAELSLNGLQLPGITMTGPRDGGFGELNDRTYQICAPSRTESVTPRRGVESEQPGSDAVPASARSTTTILCTRMYNSFRSIRTARRRPNGWPVGSGHDQRRTDAAAQLILFVWLGCVGE